MSNKVTKYLINSLPNKYLPTDFNVIIFFILLLRFALLYLAFIGCQSFRFEHPATKLAIFFSSISLPYFLFTLEVGLKLSLQLGLNLSWVAGKLANFALASSFSVRAPSLLNGFLGFKNTKVLNNLPAVPMFKIDISPKYDPALRVARIVLPSSATTSSRPRAQMYISFPTSPEK